MKLDYKGSQSDTTNTAQVAGYCGAAINGLDPGTGEPLTANWYATYCAAKPEKACMVSNQSEISRFL